MLLYINGNYPHHSLHGELVSKLADFGNEITVFVPMKGQDLDGKYRCNHPKVKIIYCDCLKATDRLFFINKTHRIVKEIEKHIDMSKVNCILAGTVYSDGFPAYMLSKKYNIPFSVAVRETDVTYQMKWRPYLNWTVKRLLGKASKIIFLSPTYRTFLERYSCSNDKFEVIPNAVNDYWFLNQCIYREMHNPVSLIFVGEISKRKNVLSIISTVAELNRRGIKTVFHIVGSGSEEDNCRFMARKLKVEQQVFFHGWKNGREKIKECYNQADIFVMLSRRETFGTVYIEALSQGLPVIYTKGQGIDGYFAEGFIGYSCNPIDIQEIADKIVMIMDRYEEISTECINISSIFRWDKIAAQYNNIICNMRQK